MLKSSEALMIALTLCLVLVIYNCGCREPIKDEKVTVYNQKDCK